MILPLPSTPTSRPRRRRARLGVLSPLAALVGATALALSGFVGTAGAAGLHSGATRVSASAHTSSSSHTSSSTTSKAQPTGVSLAVGKTLFDQTCATCHGIDAQGSTLAPALQDLGAGTVDLWVSNGWMPLAVPGAQPLRKADRYSRAETISIAEYVASLSGNRGFAIPKVDLKGASVQQGFAIYAEICAACHTITGAGDALSAGYLAPSLHPVTKTQVMEAVRTGPGDMPRLGPGILTDQQVRDVAAYVVKGIQHPSHPGGFYLGGVGPVAEGFIGLFIGVGLCALAAYWIGDRTPRGEDEAHGGEGHDGDGDGPSGEGDGREREVEHV